MPQHTTRAFDADLEDLSAKIREAGARFSSYEVMLQIQRMAQLVLEQLQFVIQSYERRDTAAADGSVTQGSRD